ncbi:transmembrane protein, putative (macronuclear) [Tetrahymena thermophila SB210]|uniref:Transmembrane protein, putative n=1 Tax=Tetrahymena thermophila (strain SB210) TaxID=312017 RepID=Q22VD1_TETTS|nr:transmembrane protein, putative [Tetrahymena thermophila SB210]EAR89234.2 transmembrane protein, putative [Tetrahymena thermophila SB210]|eukprot:XP_001009479.2 transmembrane protein, putative [Tetrahymena thermophila SB210]
MKGKKNGQKQRTQQPQAKGSKVSLCFDNFQLKKFYIEDLIHLIRPLILSKVASIIMIIISRLTILSFIYKDESYYSNGPYLWQKQNEQRLQSIANYTQYLQVFPLIDQYFQNMNPYYSTIFVSFTLNILFISALVLSFFIRNLEIRHIKLQLQIFCQFYTTIYNQWLFYVSLNSVFKLISLKNSEYPAYFIAISYLNILLTIGIGFLIETHDFSCSFKEESNYLAKQSDNTFLLLLALRAILVILNSFTSHKIIVLYSTLYFIIETLFILMKDYYLSDHINQIYSCLSAASLQICICFLVENFIFQQSDIILISIVTVPISTIFVLEYNKNKNEQLFQIFLNIESLYECKTYQFLKIIRLIIHQSKLCQNHYLYKGQGINYQAIIQVHELQCVSNDKSCFCYLYRAPDTQDGLLLQELSERHFRKEYIEHILLDIMEKYIQNTKGKQEKKMNILRLSLLNYLFEIINDPTRALINLYRTQFQFILSNKIKGAYMYYFYQLKELVMKSYQEILFESNIENQKINMIGAILFDEKINICKKQLRATLIQTGDFYDLLCGDYIPLKQLEIMSVPLITLNQELQNSFLELFQINAFDLDLQYLASVFIQVLDFQSRKISDFQKQALNIFNKSQKLKKLKEQQKIKQNNYLTENVCVVFSSFLENDYIVNKVSNSFFQIFGIKVDAILGKQLNLLVPNIVKRHHNKMIYKFIDQESLNIVQKGERHAFALDKKGFVFPITLRMKIEIFENDIGVCALLQRVNKQKSYILFEEDGKITDFSKKIFIDIFQSLDPKIEILQNAFSMIPSLEAVMESKQFYTQFCSILVIKRELIKKQKQQKEQSSPTKSINKSGKKAYSQNDDVFLIQFKVGVNTTKINVNINYVEIDFYEREVNEMKKRRIIQDLNYQQILKEKQQSLSNNVYQIPDMINNNSDRQATQISYNQDQSPTKAMQKAYFQEEESMKSAALFSPLRIQRRTNKHKTDQNTSHNYYLQENISNLLQQKSLQEDQRPSSLVEIQLVSLQQNKQSEDKQEIKMNMISKLDEQKTDVPFQTFRTTHQLQINTTQEGESFKSPCYQDGNEGMQSFKNIQIDQMESLQNFSKYNQDFYQNQEASLNNLNSFQNNNIMFQEISNYLVQPQKAIFYNNLNQIYDEESESYESSLNDNRINRINSRSTDSHDEENQKKEQMNEIASVNSSKFSSVELMKRSMIKRIQSKVYTRGQKLMIITGILAFLTLTIVTIIMYQENINSLDQFVSSFLKIDDAIYCFVDVMNILALNNYSYMLGIKKNPYIIDNLAIQKIEKKNVKTISYPMVLNDYKHNLEQLVLHNDSEESINELQNNLFLVQKFTIGFYDDQGNQLYVANTNFTQSLQYTLMEYYYSIYMYTVMFEDAQENFIWNNLMELKERTRNLQSIVNQYVNTQFNNMYNEQITIIILVVIISVFMVLTIIPLSFMIQMQKEKIMKLLGSFQPQILEFQIKLIELAIFKIDNIHLVNEMNKSVSVSNKSSKKNSKQIKLLMELALEGREDTQTNQSGKFNQEVNDYIPKYINRQQNKRNRSIASFSSLPKLSFKILLMSVVAIILLLIQPFLNIIQFSPFQSESKATLEDRITLISIYSCLIENQTPHYETLLMTIFQQYLPTETYYYFYIQNITDQNYQSIQSISNLTQSLHIPRYNEQRFEEFYKTILNGDICSVKESYPQYFNSNVTHADCNRLFGGMLNRGLLLSIKKAFDTFQELYEMYSITDLDTLLNEWILFQHQYSYIDFFQFVKVITETVNGIRQYQNQQLVQYKDYLESNLFLLFIIQLIIITLIFLIGWTYLFFKFDTQLELTNKMFTLFHISLLYENNFIQSYFKQIKIRSKN